MSSQVYSDRPAIIFTLTAGFGDKSSDRQ